MGIGRPVTGKMPVTTAALTNAYKTKLNAIPIDKNIPNGSVQFFAIFKPLIKINRKSVKTGTVPITNPSSSPMIAKIKSVCGVGRK